MKNNKTIWQSKMGKVAGICLRNNWIKKYYERQGDIRINQDEDKIIITYSQLKDTFYIKLEKPENKSNRFLEDLVKKIREEINNNQKIKIF
jgi:hypothetical protein